MVLLSSNRNTMTFRSTSRASQGKTMKILNSLVLFFFLCGSANAYIFVSTSVGKGTNYVTTEEVILVQGGVVNEDGDELAVDYNTYAHQGTSYANADFTFECNDGEGWDEIALTYTSGDDTKQWKFDTASEVKDGWVCRLSFDGSANSVERTDDDEIELAAFDDDEVTNRSTQGTDAVAPQITSVTIGSDGTTWTITGNENLNVGTGGSGGFAITMTTAGAVALTYSSGDGTTQLVYTGDTTVNADDTAADGLDYTQPTNGIEDDAGNDLANINDFTVTNNSDQGTPPTDSELESATIGTTGKTLTLVFSESVDIGAGGSGGVSLTMTIAGSLTLTYSSGSGSDTLIYTITETVYPGDTASNGLDYTNPGNGWEATDDDTDVGNLNDFSIVNNSSANANIVIAGYATQIGAGSRNGTAGNEWSLADINDPNICDTDLDANDGKIGSGEYVYLSGTFTGQLSNFCPGSAVNGPTVYDGYEDGDFVPINSTSVNTADLKEGLDIPANVDYVYIRDLKVTSDDSHGISVDDGPNDHITIDACYVYDTADRSIVFDSTTRHARDDYNTVKNCLIDTYGVVNDSASGLNIYRCKDFIVQGNKFLRDMDDSVCESDNIIELHESSEVWINKNHFETYDIDSNRSQAAICVKEYGAQDVFISQNYIYNPGSDHSGSGINVFWPASERIYIWGNVIITEDTETGPQSIMMADAPQHVYIWSNILASARQRGIQTAYWGAARQQPYAKGCTGTTDNWPFCIYPAKRMDEVHIMNNTFYQFSSDHDNEVSRTDLGLGDSGCYYTVKNNIFYNNLNPNDQNIYMDPGLENDVDVVIDDNLAYKPGETPRLYHSGYMNFSVYDTNLTVGDPDFVNAPTDFSLNAGSPGLGSATTLNDNILPCYSNPVTIQDLTFEPGGDVDVSLSQGIDKNSTYNNPFTGLLLDDRGGSNWDKGAVID